MLRIFIYIIFIVLLSVPIWGQDTNDGSPIDFDLLNPMALKSNSTVSSLQQNNVHQFNGYFKVSAFFCRAEHQLEQKSKLPLRMRLGDITYTDRIEGKEINHLDFVKIQHSQKVENHE